MTRGAVYNGRIRSAIHKLAIDLLLSGEDQLALAMEVGRVSLDAASPQT